MAGFDADCQRGMNEAGERHRELLEHRQEITRLTTELAEARKKPEPGEWTKPYWKSLETDPPHTSAQVQNMRDKHSKNVLFSWLDNCLKKIDRLTAEKENMRNWLIKIRQSKEIMEARRFADEALKGTDEKETKNEKKKE